jgi:hypothetical protein
MDRVAARNRTHGHFVVQRRGNAYAEHRPGYAQAAVRWGLEPAPGPRVLASLRIFGRGSRTFPFN